MFPNTVSKFPKTVGAERFPNGSTYVGWWSADADGVYLSDGFGTQYTAAVDGGWTFTGFYSQNDRYATVSACANFFVLRVLMCVVGVVA